MSRNLQAVPITQEAINGLAELIDASGEPDKLINQGLCGRFHNRATLDIEGAPGISVFHSVSFSMPFKMEMMERHPHGSQAFLPMQEGEYLVVLAADNDGKPDTPRAFIAGAGQGVNIGRNVWHGVLCPLSDPGLFMVVDRVTDGPNLEEHWFDTPFTINR
ncbi:ureidoglycolate lyase [Primorskyibacter sp. 2E233]|uniref:ureidoglycolate lyase n=1 Tax=Primorskyibacter sp. 2E233 TaxID=3413431 RepID=UPI003BF041E2